MKNDIYANDVWNSAIHMNWRDAVCIHTCQTCNFSKWIQQRNFLGGNTLAFATSPKCPLVYFFLEDRD